MTAIAPVLCEVKTGRVLRSAVRRQELDHCHDAGRSHPREMLHGRGLDLARLHAPYILAAAAEGGVVRPRPAFAAWHME